MTPDLDALAELARTDPAGTLDQQDWLGAAIDDDRKHGRFDAWGASTVIDENLGTPVLEMPLFDALHARAGLRAEWPVGNAGLLHVYGYLLSTVVTPYGLKRDRWLDGALARAYGLAPDTFVPSAREASLLARVGDAASALLARGAARTAEVATVPTAVAVGRIPGSGDWALVYAVRGRLVTTFPVASPETVLAEWDAAPARLRWNAA